jgi:uncharacterized protein (TIGR03790 family)
MIPLSPTKGKNVSVRTRTLPRRDARCRRPKASDLRRRGRFLLAACFALWALLAAPRVAIAQSAENVAVVVNEASPASVRIGEYYVKKRAVPDSNVIRIRTHTGETIERDAYLSTIEAPIAAALTRGALQDRILYVVLTKGIPLRLNGSAGQNGTIASVDSELTLLYLRMVTGQPTPAVGRVANPYFLGTRTIREAARFTHRAQPMYLVTRLDAFSVEDVFAMIDRAQAPASEGVIVLDQRGGFDAGTGDDWLAEAARRLQDLGHAARIALDTSINPAAPTKQVLGYYSWGSNDARNAKRRVGMEFAPGALAATFVSTDGRTFEPPPDDWTPSEEWKNPSAAFGGSPQTLTGDLIREGVTGVAGHVSEPYLESVIRPQILFPTYLEGFNLAEAFYLAMPSLSWQTIVIGDPLCVPFPRRALTRTDIEDPIEKNSGLPGVFRNRRLEVLRTSVLRVSFKDVPQEALDALLAADAREIVGDIAGARAALEQTTALAPKAVAAQLKLAMVYGKLQEHRKAVERYRIVIEAQPQNPMALNNLAYALGVHLKTPEEALPFARRALALAPESSVVLDTVGWIEYLSGNTATAAKLLSDASRRNPDNAEIRLHTAIVSAGAGSWLETETHLREALRLDPSLAKREDVVSLQRKLGERRK